MIHSSNSEAHDDEYQRTYSHDRSIPEIVALNPYIYYSNGAQQHEPNCPISAGYMILGRSGRRHLDSQSSTRFE